MCVCVWEPLYELFYEFEKKIAIIIIKVTILKICKKRLLKAKNFVPHSTVCPQCRQGNNYYTIKYTSKM